MQTQARPFSQCRNCLEWDLNCIRRRWRPPYDFCSPLVQFTVIYVQNNTNDKDNFLNLMSKILSILKSLRCKSLKDQTFQFISSFLSFGYPIHSIRALLKMSSLNFTTFEHVTTHRQLHATGPAIHWHVAPITGLRLVFGFHNFFCQASALLQEFFTRENFVKMANLCGRLVSNVLRSQIRAMPAVRYTSTSK